jgi:formylglycine-generating enzyme required for sulfatase activity
MFPRFPLLILVAAAGAAACSSETRDFGDPGGAGGAGAGSSSVASTGTGGAGGMSGTGGSGGGMIVAPEGMVAVPAGEFWMGCNEDLDPDCSADEFPYHAVTLDAYAIDAVEVAVKDYLDCVNAGACSPPSDVGTECNHTVSNKTDHPVNCVSWDQAAAYCASVGKRLPTEAEWEKAARGTDGRVYPWGNTAPDCNHAVMSNCGSGTAPVGSKPAGASPYLALDMAGNVHEWVSDWYKASYYLESPASNPQGPPAGTLHGLRGGAHNYSGGGMRTSFRVVEIEGNPVHGGVGFRCAVSL